MSMNTRVGYPGNHMTAHNFLEITEALRNTSNQACDGPNNSSSIHFYLNVQIDIHRLSSDMIWGPDT